MPRYSGISRTAPLVLLITFTMASQECLAEKLHFHELRAFTGPNGAHPYDRFTLDKLGNLYGTTPYGGANNLGTVFKMDARGREKVLYSFGFGSDAQHPYAGVIRDNSGNLFGTAEAGLYGGGALFEIPRRGSDKLLYNFGGFGEDDIGTSSSSSLIRDRTGNLYGTNTEGGAHFRGTVFKLAPDGTASALHAFNDSDGARPFAGLMMDEAGTIYGTTMAGGDFTNCLNGCGVAFKLEPDGTETTLHVFTGGTDGATPMGGLVEDGAGNLYGTTSVGGAFNAGIVFKLTPQGAETIIYTFRDIGDGGKPFAGLVWDKSGVLYGTTTEGGNTIPCVSGCGTVFKLTPHGRETVLHTFVKTDGMYPRSALAEDAKGNLFGTTNEGGFYGLGTAFSLTRKSVSR